VVQAELIVEKKKEELRSVHLAINVIALLRIITLRIFSCNVIRLTLLRISNSMNGIVQLFTF